MAFEQQINNFTNYGTFSYKFDSAGNLILNASSSVFQQQYLSMDLVNFDYDESKILSFYDPTLQEFAKTDGTSSAKINAEIQDFINNISQENLDLKTQLDDVISSVNSAAKTVSNEQEIKDIILQLRIALKQGKTESDFYTTFPYLPLTEADRSSGETTVEEMLPESTQLLPSEPTPVFVPSTVTTKTKQITGSNYTNVADTSATVIQAVTSSGTISGLGKSVITVTKISRAHTNFWGRETDSYYVYDPNRKKNVLVKKDSATGYYIDYSTGQYYALSSPTKTTGFGFFR